MTNNKETNKLINRNKIIELQKQNNDMSKILKELLNEIKRLEEKMDRLEVVIKKREEAKKSNWVF